MENPEDMEEIKFNFDVSDINPSSPPLVKPISKSVSFETNDTDTDPATNYFAVKLQSKYQTTTKKMHKHMFDEINVMAQIDHPFIVKLFDVAQDQNIIYLYMEFMPADLFEVLKSNK